VTRKRKAGHAPSTLKQQLALARQAHAQGAMGTEDYIWAAMQCYAADTRPQNKQRGGFVH
jgi:hypothetical protein